MLFFAKEGHCASGQDFRLLPRGANVNSCSIFPVRMLWTLISSLPSETSPSSTVGYASSGPSTPGPPPPSCAQPCALSGAS